MRVDLVFTLLDFRLCLLDFIVSLEAFLLPLVLSSLQVLDVCLVVLDQFGLLVQTLLVILLRVFDSALESLRALFEIGD